MDKENNSKLGDEEGEEEIDEDMSDALSPAQSSNRLHDEVDEEEEEGEEEVEDLEDVGQDEDDADDLTRPPSLEPELDLQPLPEIETVPEPTAPAPALSREPHRIRLVFNAKGTKRKAEEEIEEVIESAPASQAGTEIEVEAEPELEVGPDHTKEDEATAGDLAEKAKEQVKRMPRKKRKWLKKGEGVFQLRSTHSSS